MHKAAALMILAYDPGTKVLERQKKRKANNPRTGLEEP